MISKVEGRAEKLTALREIELERQRRQFSRVDICDWGERRFYIAPTRQPIRMPLHQKAVLRLLMQLDDAGIRLWTRKSVV